MLDHIVGNQNTCKKGLSGVSFKDKASLANSSFHICCPVKKCQSNCLPILFRCSLVNLLILLKNLRKNESLSNELDEK